MAEQGTQKHFSRSALAEKLGVTLKELTQVLIDSGWLLHNESAAKSKGHDQSSKAGARHEWQLTEKGRFEGGIYKESKKFGQYIVWPESVLSHPAITQLLDSRISATSIGRHYDISPRIVNRLLAELGWLQSYAKGWQLTAIGESYGGIQKHDKQSGVPYVVWPRTLLADSYFSGEVARYDAQTGMTSSEAVEIDADYQYISIDGRHMLSIQEVKIANWLYLHGLLYAYRRELALGPDNNSDKTIITDFYLPKSFVHVFYQGVVAGPDDLNRQLSRQELAKEYKLSVIELTDDDIEQLDHVLPRALLQWDIEC